VFVVVGFAESGVRLGRKTCLAMPEAARLTARTAGRD